MFDLKLCVPVNNLSVTSGRVFLGARHCRTGSSLARTNLSPFARCTLGLSRHFIKNILCDHCFHDSGLYIQKILSKREMINCQKFNFLLFLTINSVTTAVRELNETSQISLVTHDAKGEMREI